MREDVLIPLTRATEMAKRLGFDPLPTYAQFYRATLNSELPSERLGKQYLIKIEDLRQFGVAGGFLKKVNKPPRLNRFRSDLEAAE